MAAKCMYCEKRRQYGNLVSHSKRRTPTTFKVNIQKRRVMLEGKPTRVKLCTNCIKLLRKRQSEGQETRGVVLLTHHIHSENRSES